MDDDFYLKEKRLLRLKDILKILPIGRSTWYHWIQLGLAPKPIHISLRISAWKAQDIENLVDEMTTPEWSNKIRQRYKEKP